MKRGDRCRRQRFGDVADAAPDQTTGSLGMGVTECLDTTGDFRKQVTGFELQIMVVQLSHENARQQRISVDESVER